MKASYVDDADHVEHGSADKFCTLCTNRLYFSVQYIWKVFYSFRPMLLTLLGLLTYCQVHIQDAAIPLRATGNFERWVWCSQSKSWFDMDWSYSSSPYES
jgi:hypothetical protein